MKVRALHTTDLDELRSIHQRDYPNNIFPDFTTNCLAAFVIESDDNRILTAGGIKNTIKAELITNQETALKERSKALYEANRYINLACIMSGMPSLYAMTSIQNDTWIKALEHNGFQKLTDIVLVKDF